MDINETNETSETNENFGVEIAKAFTLAAAASIGTLAGFVVVGAVASKIQKSRASRETKKAAKPETTK